MISRLLARRLQTQLLVWTTLIVVVSVGVTFEVRMRLNLRMLEDNLRDRTEALVRAVDRTLMLGSNQMPAPALAARLREFVETDPTLTRLDIIENRNSGLRVLASSWESPDLLIPAIPAATTTEIRSAGEERNMIAVQPVADSPYAIVALASLESLDRYEASNRSSTLLFSGILIVIVIILMQGMYKRTVSKRFD